MSARNGRPPLADPRTKGVSIRLNAVEVAAVKRAAIADGMGIGPWMRARVLDAANGET